MPIIHSSPTGKRGKKDARRHRDKQRKAIKEKIPDIISEENIITKRAGKVIRVPIRGINIPDFRPGNRRTKNEEENAGGAAGVGQGSGNTGDIIGRKPGSGSKPGGAGQEPGEDYIETEIDLEEVIEMMMEDLGLPNLEKKEAAELEVVTGFKISGLRRSGPWALLDKKRTAREGLKRFFAYLEVLKTETSRTELECCDALKQADGRLGDAIELLENQAFQSTMQELEPFPIFEEDDFRFHNLKEDISHESNAVVIAELDVSGSMSTMKKYLARSLLFWLVEFLRKLYDNVEVRFIIYHSEAKIVDEYTAFHTMESGGTMAFHAHEKARGLIESQYPANRWNAYVFQFSDGDDFDSERAVEEVRKLIEEVGINMFGYGEILIDQAYESSTSLMSVFSDTFSLRKTVLSPDEFEMHVGERDLPFVGAKIKDRSHVWMFIKELLKKGRWLE